MNTAPTKRQTHITFNRKPIAFSTLIYKRKHDSQTETLNFYLLLNNTFEFMIETYPVFNVYSGELHTDGKVIRFQEKKIVSEQEDTGAVR